MCLVSFRTFAFPENKKAVPVLATATPPGDASYPQKDEFTVLDCVRIATHSNGFLAAASVPALHSSCLKPSATPAVPSNQLFRRFQFTNPMAPSAVLQHPSRESQEGDVGCCLQRKLFGAF